jgi:hypothetical protein
LAPPNNQIKPGCTPFIIFLVSFPYFGEDRLLLTRSLILIIKCVVCLYNDEVRSN